MDDRSITRRRLLEGLSAVGIASALSGDIEVDTDGSVGVSETGENVFAAQQSGPVDVVYVRGSGSALPADVKSLPALGVTGEGYFAYTTQSDGWVGPLGVGSADSPAAESHFQAATVHGPLRAEQVIRDDNIYDIRSYGAQLDGETDDRQAIVEALDAAAETNGTVLVPSGTVRIDEQIEVTERHSGITLRGQGYGSHIKLSGGHTTNHQGISLHSESGDPIYNVTVSNLRLDGNQENQSSDHGLGILTWDHSDPGTQITLENLWTHDWALSGVELNLSGTQVRNVASWDNAGHGIASENDGRDTTVIQNVYAWNNDSYGIDISDGRHLVTNFTSMRNRWGFKTAGSHEMTIFSNGTVVENDLQGFQMTVDDAAEFLAIDNVESRRNGHEGFRFAGDVAVVAGNLVSVANNQSGGPYGNVRVKRPVRVYGNTVVASGANSGYGFSADGTATVDSLVAKDNDGPDLLVESNGVVHVTHADAGQTDTQGTYVKRNVAHASLDGEPPDASNWWRGVFVHDTDTTDAVYLVVDAGRSDGAVQLAG